MPFIAAVATVTATAAALTVGPTLDTSPTDPGSTAAAASAPQVAGTLTMVATTTTSQRTVRLRLLRAIRKLPVGEETRRGYERDKFRHWIDANGDCQDTRDEVLDAESTVDVSGCDIRTGRWESYYDGEVWTDSSDVDIDHLVPLAESWDSGARRWTADTRQRYANDLRDPRPLVAVTDNVNQSKSDQDPAEWMPTLNKCTYVRQWVAVKLRWRLKVDEAEKRALRRRARNCANTVVKVDRAKVAYKKKSSAGGGGGRNCSTGYTPCLPPPPPDLDCAHVDGPISVWGSDPHHLDGDGDGVACE